MNVKIITLVFPVEDFQMLLRLLAMEPSRIAYCVVGISRSSSETEYLVQRVTTDHTRLNDRDRKNSFCISQTVDHPSFSDPEMTSGTLGALIVGRTDIQHGETRSPNSTPSESARLGRIRLVGAGMRILSIGSTNSSRSRSDDSNSPMQSIYSRFSRTIGGLGFSNWRRLIEQRIAVVGCGRSGSLAAVTLAKMGIQNITLIDPDGLEGHNLAEMDGVRDDDVGRSKADVLSDYLHAYCSSPQMPLNIASVVESIKKAQSAAKSVEIIISCVDSDEARLACGLLATLYHKVQLDIGTGIFNPTQGKRETGADIRLLLPTNGCIQCFGSVVRHEDALLHLGKDPLLLENRRDREPWWMERKGSLRTLNSLAVHIRIQHLFDMISEQIHVSRWTQLEIDEEGRYRIKHEDKSHTSTERCSLCQKAGMGDDGLLW